MPNNNPTSPDNREYQIGQLLRRAYTHAKKHSGEALQQIADITPIQASALLALEQQDMSQAELGRWIDMEPANIHSFVRRLAVADLVALRPTIAGGKRLRVSLTPIGRACAAQVRNAARQAADETLVRLSDDERRALAWLLEKMLS